MTPTHSAAAALTERSNQESSNQESSNQESSNKGSSPLPAGPARSPRQLRRLSLTGPKAGPPQPIHGQSHQPRHGSRGAATAPGFDCARALGSLVTHRAAGQAMEGGADGGGKHRLVTGGWVNERNHDPAWRPRPAGQVV